LPAPSFPNARPVGRALLVGGASARSQPLAAMQALGFECSELDDPYAAAAELYRRPLVYRALVLSLASLFREELSIVSAIKRRLPHVEIWLTHLEGRQAAFAEAIRLGADGLLADDGLLHRMAAGPEPARPAPDPHFAQAETVDETQQSNADDYPSGEPVLSAEELRALLQEQDIFPQDHD
jgi:hypothetical protein